MALGQAEIIRNLRRGLRDRDYENLFTGDRHGGPRRVRRRGETRRLRLRGHRAGSGDRAFPARLAGRRHRRRRAHRGLCTRQSTPSSSTSPRTTTTGAEAVARAADAPARVVGQTDVEVVARPFRRNMKGYEEVPTLRAHRRDAAQRQQDPRRRAPRRTGSSVRRGARGRSSSRYPAACNGRASSSFLSAGPCAS